MPQEMMPQQPVPPGLQPSGERSFQELRNNLTIKEKVGDWFSEHRTKLRQARMIGHFMAVSGLTSALTQEVLSNDINTPGGKIKAGVEVLALFANSISFGMGVRSLTDAAEPQPKQEPMYLPEQRTTNEIE